MKADVVGFRNRTTRFGLDATSEADFLILGEDAVAGHASEHD
jgi:hypothetical protein